jgi:hypothetical protein
LLGTIVGFLLGTFVEGLKLGAPEGPVGSTEGKELGAPVGIAEGIVLGAPVGITEGRSLGTIVGLLIGTFVEGFVG